MDSSEWMIHVEYLAKFFAREDDAENDSIFESIHTLPNEIMSDILVRYVTRAMRNVPTILVDKEDLLVKSNRNHRVFDEYLSTLLGRSIVYSHLGVITNIIRSAYFNETYYDMSLVFLSILGFEPSVVYMRKLRDNFPNHALFQVVPLD